jgi:hypothetical protein
MIAVAIVAAAVSSGCQKPTDSTSTSIDDFVDASLPGSVNANASTDGRTYRVTRNNDTDLILLYQYKTQFTVTITLNGNASQDKYDLTFPVKLTQASAKVNQASGGIVTSPTGGDTEHSDFVISNASSNSFAGANTSITMTYDIWYTLPSGGKEALITVSFNMTDDAGAGKTFAKTATLTVNP